MLPYKKDLPIILLHELIVWNNGVIDTNNALSLRGGSARANHSYCCTVGSCIYYATTNEE